MADVITYRETIEDTIALPRDDHEADEMYGEGDRRDVKVFSKEEIGRRHEPDYTIGCDMDAELYFLPEDEKRIFESLSHDSVINQLGSLGHDVYPPRGNDEEQSADPHRFAQAKVDEDAAL